MSQNSRKIRMFNGAILAVLVSASFGSAQPSFAADSGIAAKIEGELKILFDGHNGDNSVKRKISKLAPLSTNRYRDSLFRDSLNFEMIENDYSKEQEVCSGFLGKKSSTSLEAFCAEKTVGKTGFAQATANCTVYPPKFSKAMSVPVHRLVTCSASDCRKGADACRTAPVTKADRAKIAGARVGASTEGKSSDEVQPSEGVTNAK